MNTSNRKSVPPTLDLEQLESRDVPATYYVERFSGGGPPDGSLQTFDAGLPTQVTGLKYGASPLTPGAVLFGRFNDATYAAVNNHEVDTIYLAHKAIEVNTIAGPVALDDNITLIGSGNALTLDGTVLYPNTNTAGPRRGIFEVVNPGSNLNVFNLTLDGQGSNPSASEGYGFYFEASSAYFNNVHVRRVQYDTNQGVGLAFTRGSYANVVNSAVSSYGRAGIRYADSSGGVYDSTIRGFAEARGILVNYGVQISGGSLVTIRGLDVNWNTATSDLSAGVWLYQDGGAPAATITYSKFFENTIGVRVGAQLGNDASTAVLHRNEFTSSNTFGDLGVLAQNNTVVDATRNYWYSRRGPTDAAGGNPNGVGAAVSTQVDYRYWLQNRTVFDFNVTLGEPTVAVSAGSGGGGPGPVFQFNRFGGTNLILADAFDGTWAGEVRTATGDVTGDGVPDTVVAAGPGGGPRVQVYDGATGKRVRDFFAYDPAFAGGVLVAVGDVNNDGFADIVTGAGPGGTSHVKVYDGATGAILKEFLAYDPAFAGGVTVAVGDVNNDGFADIVTGAGPGGTPHVKVFAVAATITSTGSWWPYSSPPGCPISILGETVSFLAFAPDFAGGVFVAAGDVNGDGRADIVVGAGADPHVRVWASNLDGTHGPVISDFLVPDVPTFAGGVRVAARDLDDDGAADLILGLGTGIGGDTKIRTVNATQLSLAAPPLGYFAPSGLYPGTPGVWVG